jgi:DNA-binding winged helix-turn-helix (wHTH) protein
LGAAGAVVVCTAVAVGLFLHAYATLSRAAFRDRATTYAQAFAATAESWLARGQVEVAEMLAGFLVTGSVVSVEVVGADGAVVVKAGAESSGEGAGARDENVSRAPRLLAVDVPMPSAGRVRMKVDASSSDLAVRLATTLAALGALLFDGGVIALLAWALRKKHADAEAAPAPPAGEKRISIGELVIVPSRYEASYAGEPLRLTPKQFALLGVLASDPGRVFSEAEILAVAWPDSPYADARDIKQYVYLLRRRLSEIRPGGRDVIVTVPGFGYRLDDGR